jgi:hypothetical protein
MIDPGGRIPGDKRGWIVGNAKRKIKTKTLRNPGSDAVNFLFVRDGPMVKMANGMERCEGRVEEPEADVVACSAEIHTSDLTG